MLLISMRVNFLFGYSFGQTPEKAEVFGWVSVISDALERAGPDLYRRSVRAKRQWSVAGAAAIWIVCFFYSVTLGARCRDRRSIEPHRQSRNHGA